MRKGKVESKMDVLGRDDLFSRNLNLDDDSFSTLEEGKFPHAKIKSALKSNTKRVVLQGSTHPLTHVFTR